MRRYAFSDFIEDIDAIARRSGIYCSITEWNRDPLNAPLFLAEAPEEDDPEWDEKIEAAGLQELFRTSVLRSIINQERAIRPGATLPDIVAAANHYRRFDSFRQ